MANGIYTNSELVDTMLSDMNNLLRYGLDGQYVQACAVVTQIAQKLVTLRDSIKADIANKDKTIEELKNALRNAGNPVEDITPEDFLAEQCGKAGAANGTD
jgi:hypothetical protein